MQTIPTVDLYRELEVHPDATADTIDAAWKSLLKRHHPDVAGDAQAALERVKRLNLAHEWLSDARRRAMYDLSRRRPRVVDLPPRANRPERAVRPPATAPADGMAAPTRPGTRPPDEPESARPQGRPANASRHNPYVEYAPPGHPAADGPAGSETARRLPSGLARVPGMLVPVALVSVLVVVAISSYLASIRVPPAANTSVLGASSSPALLGGSGASAVPGGGGVASPRGLPAPNLASVVPAGCHGASASDAFTFQTQVGSTPAQVYVVQCDESHAFGPIVYLAEGDAWRLKAKGTLLTGNPYQAFVGGLSGQSADEFGIAWIRGDPLRSTLSLYRIGDVLNEFWDSRPSGLQWSLASYTYRGTADATAGDLIVTWADLATGTRNCGACNDHQLRTDVYRWGTVLGRAGLYATYP